MLQLLLVDDHASTREALAYLIEQDAQMRVVAQAGTIIEALEQFRSHKVDAVLVDLILPDGDGIELIRRFRQVDEKIILLLLTASNSRIEYVRALESGASGVLHKSVSANDIVSAISKVANGESIHSLQEVMELFQMASRNRTAQQNTTLLLRTLTPREKEILQALADGLVDQAIAEKLSISIRTVQTHIANVVSKLQVDSRLQAVVMATRTGVIHIYSDFDEYSTGAPRFH
jgi:DNA-binding NarL/FixJ family response regulator